MAVVRQLGPVDRDRLEAFLQPRLASSMFLVSNLRAAGLQDSGQAYSGAYAGLVEDGELQGVVAHYWNGNLIVQAPGATGAVCRAALAASGRPCTGVLGPAEQVAAALAELQLGADALQVDEVEFLYALPLEELVVPADLAQGLVSGRPAEPRDRELLVRWRVDYAVAALGETDRPELAAQLARSIDLQLARGDLWLLEAAGAPVATSAFNAAIAEAVQVGGVWTPPELRGRGHGRAVVAASLHAARAAGKRTAVLFTGVQNRPAQRAYEALGFQRIGDYRMVLLPRAAQHA